jgi:hypothetical protein
MTGKASALGSKIKFESGTVKATDIDPFGADVVYNDAIGGYVVRSGEQARAQIDAAAASAAARAASPEGSGAPARALARFNELSGLYEAIATRAVSGADQEKARATQLDTVRVAMVEALRLYLGAATTSDDQNERLAAIQGSLDKLVVQLGKLAPVTAEATKAAAADIANAAAAAVVAQLKDEVARVVASKTEGAATSVLCGPTQIVRKGFQIMGPEGLTSFNQDTRLIMAMHTSAEPLIQTLQEYSGRILKSKVNAAGQLLPLVRENVRVVEAERALDRFANQAAGAAKPGLAAIADGAVEAFDPPVGVAKP